MKNRRGLILLAAAAIALTAAPLTAGATGHDDEVSGNSQGNHDLGCRVIEPTGDQPSSGYPVIAWADGWYQGNQNGSDTTTGYFPGLDEWAGEGFMVVAVTAWSARQTDLLRCLTWLFNDSQYSGQLDRAKVGVAGHSQGGGAALKAGDGDSGGKAKGPTQAIEQFKIAGVVAMNPYGPAFGAPETITGPVLFLGGTEDTTTPTDSFYDAWQSVEDSSGGILAELRGGTHNSEAWCGGNGDQAADCDASLENFGAFQDVSNSFWHFVFNGTGSIAGIANGLDANDWNVEHS